ncbi:hypothetical protein F3B77_11810 [Bacteroides ovatus]|jgi:hypothetical protein|uniref:Uncharacterized protein n=1 Tax=Bacteroides ovatus TaxID=28116 RepID=A0A5M5M7L1_BACOV|nr:hypothetical protein [Bacteroides ovatus]KAA2459165.1 hypothetical protein F2X73_15780 [Alistipes onderdonkii]KAA4070631.1 hypothetical protein F3D37_09150 [Bacteroides ovatus]KAA4078670.1 hypothetical protein F3D38_10190 [Bacteroides ovatus]KAA4097548.1 hypothetical protein F3D40_12140 [Bacteroides ovatus]KAA4112536.1 hypothetical protein F3D35_13070 [Bacteroides ovatus]
MGFTTAAFIRRNTPELRKKLEELGYKNYGNPFQITDESKLITTIDGEYVPYNVPLDDSFIDCGTNEELFLAIVALRDDTNENQWFTNGEEWAYHPKTECCSPCNTVYRTLAFDSIPKDTNMGNYHKATVEELIEHFKGKE